MKKYLFKISTFALFLCGVLSSCQDDEVINEKINTPVGRFIQLVEITNNNEIVPVVGVRNATALHPNYALKFASESDYEETLKRIESMDIDNRLAFADSLGLTSLRKLLAIADDELAEIDSTATDQADFNTKYAQYKMKYANCFVFNNVDLTDISPYIPDGDNYASYLVGVNHSIVIGNKVTKIAYSDQMSPTDKALFANPKVNDKKEVNTRTSATEPEAKWDVNSFEDSYSADGNKYKVSFNIHQSTVERVVVSLGAKKKGLFGYRRPNNQVFYFKLGLTNFQYLHRGPYGQEIWTGSPALIYEYSASGGTIDFEFGRFAGNSAITGKAYVWTEHTVEKNSNGVIREIVQGVSIPKCLNSKAYACRINLNRN